MNTLYKKPSDLEKGLFSDVENKTFDFSLIEVKDGKVNARNLQKFLNNKREFAHYIKDRLIGFEEGIDFDKIVKPHKNNKKEYFLTVETAKHLAMIERNKRGKQARNYFIQAEKKLRQLQGVKPLTKIEILELALQTEKENIKLKADNAKLATRDLEVNTLKEYKWKKQISKNDIGNQINQHVRDKFLPKIPDFKIDENGQQIELNSGHKIAKAQKLARESYKKATNCPMPKSKNRTLNQYKSFLTYLIKYK